MSTPTSYILCHMCKDPVLSTDAKTLKVETGWGDDDSTMYDAHVCARCFAEATANGEDRT